ncbi:hypothetical protein HYH03_002777 [Edaphochlamys debaryana]|uniref:Uncharacterized protein n=1 Tax=Edaphochlamys debaryana TaxID=47281 RepID=A0A836C3K2_9CHLO|nr:hypothetical protein HYH03_002777 [Edaphochlamys debaryana]|eukprot:KAG2499196.1 hypothetical protein HYH03_002777 [Edaphochlamys debaryana]
MSDPAPSGDGANSSGAGGSAGKPASKADAIWAQLKSSGPKAQNVNFNKLWAGFTSDPAAGPIGPKKPVATYQEQLVPRSAPRAPASGSAGAPAAPAPQQPAATAKPDSDTALQVVVRCVAGLKDSSTAARRKALQDVQSQILDNPALDEAWLTERLESDGLGKALLRRFDDPSESHREMAVTCLLRLLRAAPGAVLTLLPYVFPVLSERVCFKEEGAKNLTEPCEEVRLGLARLLRALVAAAGGSFGAYAGEGVGLVEALAEDPFHEVQEEACGVVVALNEHLGLRLQPVAKQLVAALLPLTTAKRHRVRVAALQALRPTMHQGAHEMILEMVAWRDPNVIPVRAFYGDDLKVNFCGKLAADPHPAVRREFLAVLADWMTGLRERMDHEPRLLPFVLSALNDESPDIQADAVALLERLGEQYERDHDKELREALAYLPPEAHGIGWQAEGAAGYVYGQAPAGEETVNGGRAVFVLPGPLRSRPRLGTRRLVQSSFGRIVGALAEEACSWLLEARRRAAALLRTQLLVVEEWAEQHLHLLLPAMCRAITDPEVRTPIRDSGAILGAFTDPQVALQLLGPRVTDDAADLGQRAAALELLACVIRGAGPRRALDPLLGSLLELLCGEQLVGSEDTRVRRALQEVVEQLLATCGPACGRHAPDLLWLCLHLRAPGRASAPSSTTPSAAPAAASTALAPALAASAAAAVEMVAAGPEASGVHVEGVMLPRLAEACGFAGGVDELVEAHRAQLLERVQPGSSSNVPLASGVLSRLILPYASLSYMLYLPEEELARVLPPAEPDTAAAAAAAPDASTSASAMQLDGGSGARGSASGGADAMEVEPASSSGRAAAGAPYWSRGSTAAVVAHVAADLGWLPRQPRCAIMVLACLEACLRDVPGPLSPAGNDAELGEAVLCMLCQALAACDELPPHALLAALRSVRCVLARGLVPAGVLAAPARLEQLAARLASAVAVVSSSACRLQAVHVIRTLLRCPATSAPLAAATAAGGAAAATALTAVCSAASSRLYDAADEVRCAALDLAKELAEVAVAAGAGAGSAGGPVQALVAEVGALRDVTPGSAFFDEHRAFRAWAAQRLPAGWLGAAV